MWWLSILRAITTRRNCPSGRVFQAFATAGEVKENAKSRKLGRCGGLRSKPPLACALALMRLLPHGAIA